MGGHINNYLLEKSRVIGQQPGDNNFHSFYQLLRGSPDQLIQKFGLSRDVTAYKYLCQNNNKTQLPQKVTISYDFPNQKTQYPFPLPFVLKIN